MLSGIIKWNEFYGFLQNLTLWCRGSSLYLLLLFPPLEKKTLYNTWVRNDLRDLSQKKKHVVTYVDHTDSYRGKKVSVIKEYETNKITKQWEKCKKNKDCIIRLHASFATSLYQLRNRLNYWRKNTKSDYHLRSNRMAFIRYTKEKKRRVPNTNWHIYVTLI